MATISSPENQPVRMAIRDGLQGIGWRDGDNIQLEWRFVDAALDEQQVKQGASDLVRDGVDVIVTPSVPITRWVMQVTHSVPIVMGTSVDPVEQGVIASYAHPGGNVTGEAGSVSSELVPKWIQELREVVPSLKRLGVLWNPISSSDVRKLQIAQGAAAQSSVNLVSVTFPIVSDPDGLGRTLLGLAGERIDGIYVFNGLWNTAHRAEVHAFAEQQRITEMYEEGESIDGGGLLALFPSIAESCRRSTRYIDKILRGAAPADLPVELPTTFEFAMNARTASALGLTIPPSVAVQVTRWVR